MSSGAVQFDMLLSVDPTTSFHRVSEKKLTATSEFFVLPIRKTMIRYKHQTRYVEPRPQVVVHLGINFANYGRFSRHIRSQPNELSNDTSPTAQQTARKKKIYKNNSPHRTPPFPLSPRPRAPAPRHFFNPPQLKP